MQTIVLPRAILTAHDSPHRLPESRWREHNYYALIESNVGSSQDDIDRHFDVQLGLVGSDDLETQVTAVNNLRFLFANILGKQYSARSLALCCLVETIDNVSWSDYSPDGLEKLSRILSEKGLTDELLLEQWPALKQKIYDELNEAFPLRFPDDEEEQIVLHQQALLIELDTTFSPDDPSLPGRIESFNLEIQERLKPAKLTGKGNKLDEIRRTYVANKIALQLEGLPVDDNTSSIAYWQYVEAIEAKHKSKHRSPRELME